MNLLDITVLVLLFVCLLLGWKIRSIRLFSLVAAACLGAWAGNHFQARMLAGFQAHVSPPAAAVLAWFTPCLITGIAILLLGLTVSAIFDTMALGWFDRALGAALAGTALLLVLAFGLARMQTAPPAFLKPSLERSLVAKPLLQMVQPLLHAGLSWWPAVEKKLPR